MSPQGDSRRLRGVYSPTHHYVRVSRAETFTGRSLSSGVELTEVLDVLGVLVGDPVLCLQARGARPRDTGNHKRALPHGRELMQPLPGEHPPQDEITHLERPWADATTNVPPQRLLVPCRSERGLTAAFLPHHEIHPAWRPGVPCQMPGPAWSNA